MKQPKLKLHRWDGLEVDGEYWIDIIKPPVISGNYPDRIQAGCGKSRKTALRGAIRNLEKLLAEAEKRLEELE